jgi:hypothetical protein
MTWWHIMLCSFFSSILFSLVILGPQNKDVVSFSQFGARAWEKLQNVSPFLALLKSTAQAVIHLPWAAQQYRIGSNWVSYRIDLRIGWCRMDMKFGNQRLRKKWMCIACIANLLRIISVLFLPILIMLLVSLLSQRTSQWDPKGGMVFSLRFLPAGKCRIYQPAIGWPDGLHRSPLSLCLETTAGIYGHPFTFWPATLVSDCGLDWWDCKKPQQLKATG